MSHFYACYAKAPKIVAIFDSREARDNWTRYLDSASIGFAEPEDLIREPRIALTAEQAYVLVGSSLYNKAKHFKDELLENTAWVCAATSARRAEAV